MNRRDFLKLSGCAIASSTVLRYIKPGDALANKNLKINNDKFIDEAHKTIKRVFRNDAVVVNKPSIDFILDKSSYLFTCTFVIKGRNWYKCEYFDEEYFTLKDVKEITQKFRKELIKKRYM